MRDYTTSTTNPAHQEMIANEIMKRRQSEYQMRNEQISKNRWCAMMPLVPLLDNYTPIKFACVSSFAFDSVEIN